MKRNSHDREIGVEMAQPESSAGTGDFLREILDLAVAIELECAGVYEVFASQFTENEELATFWRLYAEAERYHAATIRLHHQKTIRPTRQESVQR